jgi:hypothetical protein
MSRFVFFQQIVGLVQNFYVGSPLGDLNPLSSARIEKHMIFPASNASAELPRRPRAADAATELPTVAALLPRCLRRSADAAAPLPPPSSCCHRHRSTAAVAAALSPCFPTAHHRRRCAAAAALTLPTPPPRCPPSPRRCRSASAALPTLPPRSRH